MKIALRHGSGGEETTKLIQNIFAAHFQNDILNKMEDAAVLPKLEGNPVFTSDSFVVQPLFFPGGDIGRLAVCGTVNDLACMGAKPLYLTASFILEAGLETETLEKIVCSMEATAEEAGVKIVAGDTKVVEGNGGLYINTAGIGVRPFDCNISAANLRAGDTIILTGTLGDHHATILTQRLEMETTLQSDCAPLNRMVAEMLDAGIDVHTIRDITRGGLATVASELAEASGCRINLKEDNLPVSEAVKGLSGILGLDPLTMGNEGKMLLAVPSDEAERALHILQKNKYGKDACLAGAVTEGKGVYLQTVLGSFRKVLPLRGEGLPRIC
ncbi:MAG: hydrogenase expression/formation protein HypE [Acidaminococcaceae bacterium]|nr:hydrogenase expression/formation protein HypE [Acidaminococcaceae bacterium]